MGAPPYQEAFKKKMVQRLLMPGGPTALDLAAEVGIPNGTLSRWVREAVATASVDAVAKKQKQGVHKAPSPARRPDDRTDRTRLRLVLQASSLEGEELGAFLRREGLHDDTIKEWRKELLERIDEASPPSAALTVREQARMAELERDLRRTTKKLEATEALLDLAKKVQTLWGDEAADTTEDSES